MLLLEMNAQKSVSSFLQEMKKNILKNVLIVYSNSVILRTMKSFETYTDDMVSCISIWKWWSYLRCLDLSCFASCSNDNLIIALSSSWRALARDANDQLASAIDAHPDRFGGFATLPTSDPEAAAAELERTVHELGFKAVF